MRKRDGLTTRGWNGYGANEHRGKSRVVVTSRIIRDIPSHDVDGSAAFRYLTPKLRLTAEDLTPELLSSRSFHLISSPMRCIELVNGILERRAKSSPNLSRPIFIWEPVPDLCIESELDNTYEAIKHLDVISPNHAELASLFGIEATTASGDVNRSGVEECSRKLVSAVSSSERELHVVVRSGKDGCYIRSSRSHSDGPWIPAYHADNPVKVVDPTGGGNGFLGGFAIGLVKTFDPIQAAVWGSVSASLCIEQVGMPVIERSADGRETWNGVDVQKRLVQFSRQLL